jgi:DNA invertase Pin-like site-specific DNA recombinase
MNSIAIYVRVSDDKKKADGERRQDINRQIDVLKEFLNRKNITNYEVYADDGKSAYTEDLNQRPNFKRLLNDCRRYFIREIYIEDMTRFSRNLSMGLQWLKELGDLNVQLISLKEGEFEVTTAQNWLKSSIMLMFAEWDSKVKSEKVKVGMQKAKNLRKQVGRPTNKRGGQKHG